MKKLLLICVSVFCALFALVALSYGSEAHSLDETDKTIATEASKAVDEPEERSKQPYSSEPHTGKRVEQTVKAVILKGNWSFAGERLPLEDPDVLERLDRELLVNSYWHSNTILNLKIANKYFPEIENILEQYGVPSDFKYLAVAESGLRNVVSAARAVGFWQIMEETAKGYGLEVNKEVDERYDYIKSTEAACLYLLEAYRKFGSWTLAAASYNMGMGGLNKQLTKQQVDSYYDLYLNTETSRYIFRIVAIKNVFDNPEKFGFDLNDDDLYQLPAHDLVMVDTTVNDLASFSIMYGTNYKNLKLLNPWLRTNSLTVKDDKSYLVKVPKL